MGSLQGPPVSICETLDKGSRLRARIGCWNHGLWAMEKESRTQEVRKCQTWVEPSSWFTRTRQGLSIHTLFLFRVEVEIDPIHRLVTVSTSAQVDGKHGIILSKLCRHISSGELVVRVWGGGGVGVGPPWPEECARNSKAKAIWWLREAQIVIPSSYMQATQPFSA
jgi:hypothetical protein